MLGVSVAPILKSDNAVDLIKAISLTMEEFEYQVSDFAVQKMVRGAHHASTGAPLDAHRRTHELGSGPPQKQILRKTGAVGSASSEDENVFAVTPVFQETGVYTHLQLPNVVQPGARSTGTGPRRQAADRRRTLWLFRADAGSRTTWTTCRWSRCSASSSRGCMRGSTPSRARQTSGA